MIRVPAELGAILGERATDLVTLSRHGRYEEVCALTDEITSDPALSLTPAERMLLALARMGAALNAGIDEDGKRAEVAAARHAFERALPRVVRAARAAGTGLTLLVLDVDRLGWITEAYGRDVGDEVLRQVAGLLATYVPSPDRCARWGDDAFVLCLPAPAGKAAGAADRLVRAVAGHPWPTVRTGLAVTATAALVEVRPDEEPADLLARVPRR